MNNWKTVRLGDVCSLNMGQSPNSNTYNNNGIGMPFFQGNADFGAINPTIRYWCSEPVKIANIDDILISVRAPIGALNIANFTCCIGRGLAAITVDKKAAERKFIWYMLKSKINELQSKGTGSTFKAINKTTLNDISFTLPPLEIQKQIAENLDKVTRTIDICSAIIEKLDMLVKARFVEMFGDINNNYPIKKLSNICTVSSSKRIYQSEQSNFGVPFLRISNLVELIESGHFETSLFISCEKYNEFLNNNFVPKAGDILVTSRGTLGKCYIVQNNDKFYFQDGMISWLYNLDESINPLYLTMLFDTKDIKRQIANLQSGSTVAYLSIAMLKKLEIVIPPIELQNQFADFATKTEKTKLKVKQALEKIELLKSILMQKYFM